MVGRKSLYNRFEHSASVQLKLQRLTHTAMLNAITELPKAIVRWRGLRTPSWSLTTLVRIVFEKRYATQKAISR